MAYPASKTTFSDPVGTNTLSSPDHATLHVSVNDTVEAIQDTAGTTLGTNIFKNFAAGDFPVRATGGGATGTLQQTIVGGTLSQTVISNAQGTLGFLNKGTLGSVASVGGTFTGAIVSDMQGTLGFLNKGTLGSVASVGGTFSNANVINNLTFATGTITGTPVLDVNSIQGSALTTTALFLGQTTGTANFNPANGAETVFTGGTLIVTNPSGGRQVKISFLGNVYRTTAIGTYIQVNIKQGAGTLQALKTEMTAANSPTFIHGFYLGTFAAGLGTFSVSLLAPAGTPAVEASASQNWRLTAELV